MHLIRRAPGVCVLALAAMVPAVAAEPAHPIVAGFERFHTGPSADTIRGGQLLLAELNCVSCHLSSSAAIARKPAPVLDGVGNRVRAAWLRKYLSDPAATKPGTTMPNLLADDPDKAAKVEALVHFFASTGSVRHERADLKAIIQGRDHFQKLGCFACHGPHDGQGKQAQTNVKHFVPLGDLASKYSAPSLAAFLEKPHEVRPGGRMPSLVNAKEAREIAQYLLQSLKVNWPPKGSTQFEYFEGSWGKLPDFSKLKPALTGAGPAFDVEIARRGNNYALRFEGYFQIDKEGQYKFHLGSDDGSRLWIDDQLVADNDGVHPMQWNQGRAFLTKGVHKVVVGFFQVGGGAELIVDIEGGGLKRQSLGTLVAATKAALTQPPPAPKKTNDDHVEAKPELVAKGRELFGSLGCANCHSMNLAGKPIASSLSAPKLEQLASSNGCLGAPSKPGLPNYALSAVQRTALTAALAKPVAPAATPAAEVSRILTTFNCYACHAHNKIGGPDDEWNKLFLTTQQEMGDEGRIPPPLDGVGAKLNSDYFKQLLDKGADDRPYMHTRMPGFGLGNVGQLVSLFEQLDRLPAAPKAQFIEPMSRVKSAGRHLVGSNGLSCFKCHTFAGQKAEGVQGIEMLLMPKRVRYDWFYAYLLDPQKVRPGTRMPSAWYDGKSPLPKVLDGRTAAQIEAIWHYLGDSKPALPVGLRKQAIPLTPTKEAIIYRNFIEGAGPRGIAVGYPEKVHLAFDANDCRLAMIWQGDFLDAGRHWNDRGSGFEGPLGENIVHFPTGSSFATLDSPDAPWPSKAGARFLGYRTTLDERPTFLYSVGVIRVEDFPNSFVTKTNVGFNRRFTLTATKPTASVFLRAAVGAKIEKGSDGSFNVDGVYRARIDGGEAHIRQSGGKSELLVPVRFAGGKAELGVEYMW